MRMLLSLAVLVAASAAPAETIAITGVKAWTMTSASPIPNATVVIADGKLVSIEENGPVPGGARIVSASSGVVTPGLVDAATQVGLGEVGAIDEEAGSGVTKGPLGASFEVAYAIDANDLGVQQARADGLAYGLAFPDRSASAPFDGIATLLHLRPGGDIVERPRAAMLLTIGGGAARALGGSRAAGWQLVRNAFDEARLYRTRRDGGAPRDQLLNHLDAAALQAVLAGSLPLVVRTDRVSDLRQALALARDYRVRVMLLGGAEAWAIADEIAAANIAVILDPMADLPDTYDSIGARPDNAVLLAKAGVRIAFSVSAQEIYRSWNAGPSLREGAGLAVAAGLPYVQALAAITSSAADMLGLGSGAGGLRPGTLADLVLWDGDPLEPSSAPLLVMAGGTEVPLVTRQTLLRDRYAPHRR